ncbi:MAG: hypothetical protein ACE5JU_21350, partial [Candidatus Binatia bacterium]
MSCGTGDCGCGCEEFVQLGPKKSLRVIEQPEACGDGSCGCGCGDLVTLNSHTMPPWLKRSILNLWRKPFRTVLVAVFLALVVGLFTVMATVNRLAAERFAELEGALETT